MAVGTLLLGTPDPGSGRHSSRTCALTFLGGSSSPCQVSAQTAKGPCLQKLFLHLDLPLDTWVKSGAFFNFCFIKFSQKCTVWAARNSRSTLWPPTPRGGGQPAQTYSIQCYKTFTGLYLQVCKYRAIFNITCSH